MLVAFFAAAASPRSASAASSVLDSGSGAAAITASAAASASSTALLAIAAAGLPPMSGSPWHMAASRPLERAASSEAWACSSVTCDILIFRCRSLLLSSSRSAARFPFASSREARSASSFAFFFLASTSSIPSSIEISFSTPPTAARSCAAPSVGVSGERQVTTQKAVTVGSLWFSPV
jgi:hypothetical protein